tara:strand:+ start:158 stop:316 length:159 start_codon:yes stop_codon:yes gene_type:complete
LSLRFDGLGVGDRLKGGQHIKYNNLDQQNLGMRLKVTCSVGSQTKDVTIAQR